MENATPMLRQYLEIKKAYPGTILFFRLGDFYEMFNEDAIVGARELEITLTARQKDSPNPIPMCGVPHHAAATYIARLVKKGYRVAICEQAEAAGKGVKLVKRKVVRVITPGTAIDSQLTESRDSNYLSAIAGSREHFGVAFLELSTGSFTATEVSGPNAFQKAVEQIESYSPRELLFAPSLAIEVRSSFAREQAESLLSTSDRIPIGNDKSARIEVRSIAPDANPYLAIYTMFRTGFEGPIESSNGEKRRDRTKFLPDNIYDGIRLFKGSKFAADLLGEQVHKRYADLKLASADRCPECGHVTASAIIPPPKEAA